jgi:RNA polymerase sigma-70 factor (ECF subfamily)
VLRSDVGTPRAAVEVRGAEEVARRARSFSQTGLLRHPVLVNGGAGAVCVLDGKPFSVMAFTVAGGKIVEIDILRDADRLSQIDLTALAD